MTELDPEGQKELPTSSRISRDSPAGAGRRAGRLVVSQKQASFAPMRGAFVAETTLREATTALGATILWRAWEASPVPKRSFLSASPMRWLACAVHPELFDQRLSFGMERAHAQIVRCPVNEQLAMLPRVGDSVAGCASADTF